MKALFPLLVCAGLFAYGQANEGELQLKVTDSVGLGVKAAVRIASRDNQYTASLTTTADGHLDAQHLPFGLYQIEVQRPGFADIVQPVQIRSAIPFRFAIQLRPASVRESVTVHTADAAPDQAGSVNRINAENIQTRPDSIPGRSLQDLVNSQPGWVFEGNAVLHPRGSEYQTQFVVDGIPLTDNRSPSFGPEIEADSIQSVSIYTAGIPAEYGRKMGGVVEINTQDDPQPGFHGQAGVSGGSFATAGAFAEGQLFWGRNALGATGSGSETDYYLNPVVPQNYSNTGTLADFSVHYQRIQTPNDKLAFSVRHELSRYDIPNEFLQQAAGQRQTADDIETMGIASYEHIFSDRALANLRTMFRDNANGFYSNPQSTPVQVFQSNSFREAYFQSNVTIVRGVNEWKTGFESDNTFLHEGLNYLITDPSQFNPTTPPSFTFTGAKPDLEQSVFLQDSMRIGRWVMVAGLRWDHYQLLLNRNALEPRLAISRYLPAADLVLHFSYDRVFQTPSSENLLLSGSAAIDSIDPQNFLRLPVKPSVGDYYEAGLSKTFLKQIRFDASYFRRFVNDFADDDQIDNTTISFPISFRKAIIYGAEAKVAVSDWHRLSGFASYSYTVGNAWFPVTGGLFLDDNADAARSQLTGHFPDSQDQRNTLRARLRFQATPRFWFAAGMQFDSGLPFEFDGDPDTALAQYGQPVLDRLNFDRGRIDPCIQFSASGGVVLHKSEHQLTRIQVDGQNLNNVLNVLDFGGLFSGNAIGPPRSVAARLTTTF